MDPPSRVVTLGEVLDRIDKFDEELVIYAAKDPEWTATSRAVVTDLPQEDEAHPKEAEGLRLLLAVHDAKTVVEGLREQLGEEPSTKLKCEAAVYYYEHDAYMPI